MPSTPAPAISIRELTMRYGEREVLRGIDLEVQRGEVLCFLGPNGAGKTTTIEILEGYRRRTGGDVLVLGEDPSTAGPTWRGRVGVVLQDCIAEPDLTVQETVRMYAGFYDDPIGVDEVLGTVGLTAEAGVRNARLSGGQRRRLDVALALVGDPELVFLDEPTTGFDPEARRSAWEAIAKLRQLGKTVVLTTHALDEAEALADRIAVLVDGRIVAGGTPATLGNRHRRLAEVRLAPAAADALPRRLRRSTALASDGSVVVTMDATAASLHDLSGLLVAAGAGDTPLEVRRPTLEDVYFDLLAATSGATSEGATRR
jgi:ABC-2 type transport system ATP-binding protein